MAKTLQIAACCCLIVALTSARPARAEDGSSNSNATSTNNDKSTVAPESTTASADDSESSDGAGTTSSTPGVKLLMPPTANPLSAVRVEKRLFGAVPNYRAADEPEVYKPLTVSQKFKIAERDTFDWPNLFLMAGFAMQTQIAEKGWHQAGFGRNFGEYYGRTFGDALIGNYVTEAVMPTLFHEDPRFFRSGIGTVWNRAYRAARQVAVTRSTDGHLRFNCSEFFGNATVVAATSLYYPGERRLAPSAERLGMVIGNDMMSNLLTEFWPDVKRALLPLVHRHQHDPNGA